MNTAMQTTHKVAALYIEKLRDMNYVDTSELPSKMMDEFNLKPQLAIDFILALETLDDSIDHINTKILLRLIDETFAQIRYSMDRKDKKAVSLITQAQEALNTVCPKLGNNIRVGLNQTLYDSKLPLEIHSVDPCNINQKRSQPIDIMPKLPELLESLRRQKVYKTVFELYEMVVPQFQAFSDENQLALIAEMGCSKKPIAHELSVLMLLHPKASVRRVVAKVLLQLADTKHFTPIDVRRLITLRNWVPVDERSEIDAIVSHLRRNGVSPAPYPSTKISKIVGSSTDGAGVLCVFIEAKKNNQRQIAGFLLKINVGIRDTSMVHKAPKQYLDDMINEQAKNNLPMKPVSKTYVNKIVRHFLSETIENGNVPDATFIEIAELVGADNWQPQALSWEAEVDRLREIYQDQLSDVSIQRSLQRSGDWHMREDIAHSWFDTGELAEQVVIEAANQHESNPSASLEDITTRLLMKDRLDKWKWVLLFTCLWMRSQQVHELTADLLVVLHCLDKQIDVAKIPLLENIAAQTAANVCRRKMLLL